MSENELMNEGFLHGLLFYINPLKTKHICFV